MFLKEMLILIYCLLDKEGSEVELFEAAESSLEAEAAIVGLESRATL